MRAAPWLVGLGLGTLGALGNAAASPGQNPKLLAVPPNTAVDLGPYTCENPPGASGSCAAITDYSTMVYDHHHHRLLMFGGGHAGTSGTLRSDVSQFDFATLTWSSAYAPTSCAEMNVDNLDVSTGSWRSTGHPLARHTYDMLVMLDDPPEMLMVTSGALGPEVCSGAAAPPGLALTTRIAGYDPATSRWTYRATDPGQWDAYSAAEYDPVSRATMVLGSHGLWAYDGKTDTFLGAQYLPAELGYANNLVYSPVTDRMLYFARGERTRVYELTLDRATWSASTLTELVGAEGPSTEESGFAYDSVNRRIGGAVLDGAFSSFDPQAKTWDTVRMNTLPAGGTIGTMAFHEIAFDPVDGVYVFVTRWDSGARVWAYRYAGEPPPPPPPAADAGASGASSGASSPPDAVAGEVRSGGSDEGGSMGGCSCTVLPRAPTRGLAGAAAVLLLGMVRGRRRLHSARVRGVTLALFAALLATGQLLGCADEDAGAASEDNGAAAGTRGQDGGPGAKSGADGAIPPIVCPPAPPGAANDALKPVHHDGQTFVSWRDAVEGEAGATIRYDVYRSLSPITQETLATDERVGIRLLNASGKLFGTAFSAAARLDPSTGMTVIEAGGAPLAPWSGLKVYTAREEACAYYAVLPVDETGTALEAVVPGRNATTGPVTEHVSPIQPIKIFDSETRGIYSPQTEVTGTPGLPLLLELHASNAQGGGAGDYGDYYVHYGDRSMGYADGMPGVFSVEETHSGPQLLVLRTRDLVVGPAGGPLETYWFGYRTVPEWAPGTVPLAYPFTERRLEWMLGQVVPRYRVDADRVGCAGGSMGAWGSTSFCFRHPELFSVVYPDRPRTRQRQLPSFEPASTDVELMEDGITPYLERMDSVRFAAEHHEDLPFYAWDVGRQDGFATWQEQVDMVRALTEAHHGFAFLWNAGGHGDTIDLSSRMRDLYPLAMFSRASSYPAFSHSSLDSDLGNGDPASGDPAGGINVGFGWTAATDETSRWEVGLTSSIASSPMAVDVTPRRTRAFRLAPGERFGWTTSTGGSGAGQADAWGLATVTGVVIEPGRTTTLTLTR